MRRRELRGDEGCAAAEGVLSGPQRDLSGILVGSLCALRAPQPPRVSAGKNLTTRSPRPRAHLRAACGAPGHSNRACSRKPTADRLLHRAVQHGVHTRRDLALDLARCGDAGQHHEAARRGPADDALGVKENFMRSSAMLEITFQKDLKSL